MLVNVFLEIYGISETDDNIIICTFHCPPVVHLINKPSRHRRRTQAII